MCQRQTNAKDNCSVHDGGGYIAREVTIDGKRSDACNRDAAKNRDDRQVEVIAQSLQHHPKRPPKPLWNSMSAM